jgi:hypothetical protein
VRQPVHTKLLMRWFARDCDLLQNRKTQTQNPPTLAVMGVRPLPAPNISTLQISSTPESLSSSQSAKFPYISKIIR